jgi:pentatricopeptide repeat protein
MWSPAAGLQSVKLMLAFRAAFVEGHEQVFRKFQLELAILGGQCVPDTRVQGPSRSPGVGSAITGLPTETASLRNALNSGRFCVWAQHLQKRMSALCFRRNQASWVEVNGYHCSATISARETGCQWQLALNLLKLMTEARVVPNEFTYSAAISACKKGTQWKLALNLLSRMPEARAVPNEITYNAAISACEKSGQWQLALNVLSLMPGAKAVPNEITYNAAISAC